MLTITTSKKAMLEQSADCLAFFVEKDFSFSKELQSVAHAFFPDLKSLMEEREFTGDAKSVLVVPVSGNKHVKSLIFVGMGKKDADKYKTLEFYRRAVGTLVRSADRIHVKQVAVELPGVKRFGIDAQELTKETVLTAQLAAYYFDDFHTDKKQHHPACFELIVVGDDTKALNAGVKEAEIIAQATNMARHWIDSPPSVVTPPHLADEAKKIAKKYDLTFTIFNEKQIVEMGMGGLAGVSRGSDRDCQFVIMEYDCGKKTAPTIALVGKGITFDSGGLSIKPAQNMETMKEDMSGAAAVIATMQAIAQLKPKVNVVALTPISENLPSGKATMPGDILRFYNGKTAEVKNTDAEGRLILADALSYAVKHYKPDAIIDIATLTGSCAHALGPFYTGLMSQHPDLAKRVEQAGERSGDRIWPLPFSDDYKPAIKSTVADICNIGSSTYRAGAITAGFFLQNFVDDVPWVHLDIAGTASDVPDLPYYRPASATGVGVRLFVDLLMNWK
jgi:leucyl aminopeptidase